MKHLISDEEIARLNANHAGKWQGDPNPMVRMFGPLEGKTCKTCKKLFARRMSKTWYKCEIRGDTHGPGTDHRVNWNACKQYEEEIA
jgi:hypothetical protein